MLNDRNHLPDAGTYDIPCLIVKPRWLSLILSDKKSLEIRGCATGRRQWVGLIESGSHALKGFVFLSGCKRIYNPEHFWSLSESHCIRPEDLKSKNQMPYRKTYGWDMEHPVPILPVRLPPKPGAVIWETHTLSLEDFQRI